LNLSQSPLFQPFFATRRQFFILNLPTDLLIKAQPPGEPPVHPEASSEEDVVKFPFPFFVPRAPPVPFGNGALGPCVPSLLALSPPVVKALVFGFSSHIEIAFVRGELNPHCPFMVLRLLVLLRCPAFLGHPLLY